MEKAEKLLSKHLDKLHSIARCLLREKGLTAMSSISYGNGEELPPMETAPPADASSDDKPNEKGKIDVTIDDSTETE